MSKRTKKSHPILSVLLIAFCLPVAGAGLFLYSFDLNSYRKAIEDSAHEQTGRKITLAGPITWTLSPSHGFGLSVSDVTIDNPPWASRRDMAHVGNAKLHLDLLGLTRKRLDIIALEIDKTDVQLETAPNGDTNWDFSKAAADAKTKQVADQAAGVQKTGPAVSIHVRGIKITDSRFGLKDKSGKLSLIDVPELTFTGNHKGVRFHYKGSVAEAPVEIDLTGGLFELITQSDWPFNMRASYDKAKLDARGSFSNNMKKISLDEFQLVSGGTDFVGNLTVTTNGPRPSISGKVHSGHLNPDDLVLGKTDDGDNAKPAAKSAAAASKTDGKIFTNDPLPFDVLKTVDAHLDLAIDELTVSLTTAQQVKARLDLENGRLALTPVTALIAGSKVASTLNIDASALPARVATTLTAPALDLSQLFKLGGMESAISGKTDVDIDLTTTGHSTHDFAAHANGKINLLMDTGTVSDSMLRDIAGGLVNLFAPGVGSLTNPGVNCLAARYVITNGIMETKGLLLDTDMTTIAGTGYANLPDERINMSLFTRPKGLGLSSMIPPMRIIGDLTKPAFTLDAAGAVQKLTGLLTKDTTFGDGVPNLVTTTGKNVCGATLDNPKAAATSPTKPLIPGDPANIKDTVKDVGGKLLKGLFGN